jgi:hypothetical protein
MKKQIVNVSVVQTAKVAAAMYFVISLPLVAIMILTSLFTGQAGFGTFYVIFGFIFTAISAWLYNIVAARVGGIEFTTAQV